MGLSRSEQREIFESGGALELGGDGSSEASDEEGSGGQLLAAGGGQIGAQITDPKGDGSL
jgi:hypothetical protein